MKFITMTYGWNVYELNCGIYVAFKHKYFPLEDDNLENILRRIRTES
jgi:hypothetical protein